jgi:hypothetical protein
MTTRKNKPAPATAAPAADSAAMGATVLEFVNTATSGNPWAPPMVDNSRANVQPVLPAFNPNVGTSTHLPTAPTGENIAPMGESESFRQGRALFATDMGVREITLWARDKKIAPRAQAEGETPEQFSTYLEKFAPEAEAFEDFKRGYAAAFCDREGRTLHYIALDEAGKVREATADEVAAMGTEAQDARLFTVVSWAAYELSDYAFGALKGDREKTDTLKGVWYAERKRVKGVADTRMTRLQSDAIVADEFGVKPKGARGNNNKPWETHNANRDKVAETVGKVDRMTGVWYKTEMSRIGVALQERLAGFYAK